jgi:adenylate cyclase
VASTMPSAGSRRRARLSAELESDMAANDIEIERKYLLRALPDRAAHAPFVEIDQGYLPGSRINERVRRAVGPRGATYTRTIKAGSGVSRTEIEEETTAVFFETVWPLTAGMRVRKRRYSVWEGSDEWVIDEFLDRDNLVLAELELEHVEQAVQIPPWLAGVLDREVTNDQAYTNHALAR